ncbi:MAG: lysophospholipid acyltransferase family protein [Anaerolineales bacterium]|nr:lysophospholipid acyltransferase family protein [Anaerolineales bacterium]
MTTQLSTLFNFSIPQTFAKAVFNLIGWRVDTLYPPEKKYILVGAHHTSNWDLPLGILFSLASGIKFNFLAKDEAFRWPLGGIMRWLGGVPVNRRAHTNFVDQIAKTFAEREHLIIAITPEGTRKRSEYWKTGFYYIALEAKVPIALGALDYGKKCIGIGKMLIPSGDLEADFEIIRAFYADKKGKFPHQHGEIRPRPQDASPGSPKK